MSGDRWLVEFLDTDGNGVQRWFPSEFNYGGAANKQPRELRVALAYLRAARKTHTTPSGGFIHRIRNVDSGTVIL